MSTLPTVASAGGTVAGGETLLDVASLSCDIAMDAGTAAVLRDIDLTVAKGTSLGVVGESGSGKSMLLKSILGLTPAAATVRGRITLGGTDLATLAPRQRARIVGRTVGVVFQNPMTSLNPVVRIGRQIAEASRYHRGTTARQARRVAVDLMGAVGIPDAARRVDDYPHQFSGGMRQRVMIAMALACEPELLVADEATTALDVTVQKDILDLLHTIQQERGMTLILVSHDLSVVAGRADEVAVMYAGRVVEQAPTGVLFARHRHRYTAALLSAIPRIDHVPHTRLQTIPGRLPSPLDPPPGCPFAPRCAAAVDVCHTVMPPRTVERPVGAHAAHAYHCHEPVPQPPAGSRPDADKGSTA